MLELLDSLPLVVVIVAGAFAPAAGWLAQRRARNPALWFVLGAVTGPIALGVLLIAPPGRCPACDTPTQGWPATCETCGTRLRVGRAWEAARAARRTRSSGSAPDSSVEAGSADGPSEEIGPTPEPEPGPEPKPASIRRAPAPGADRRALDRSDPRPPEDKVLSTGIYLSGNAGLEIGACYAVARAGDRMRIFGPVDSGQLTVRHDRALDDVEVLALGDRAIISTRGERPALQIVLRGIGGMSPQELEQALGVGADRGAVRDTGPS